MNNTSQKNKRRMLERGFTLVEMMVVVAVIGILGSVVGGKLIGNTEKARKVILDNGLKYINEENLSKLL